ncbi:trigger factor [Deferribacteres bacterium DY0037]
MKVTVADGEKSQKILSVEIPADTYKGVFDAELAKVSKNIKIQGFREGKAPKEMVLKEKGHAVRVQALELVVNDSVKTAIEENDIRAMGQPEVKDVKFEDDDTPITFNVHVDVFPTFEITKYKGFEFTKEMNEVADEDLDAVLQNLRERQAAFEPVEGDDAVIAMGDQAVMDFEGSMNGEVIPNATAKDFALEIGSGQFVPGFEEQCVGIKKGEKKDIVVTFPENYQEPSMAGQPVTFAITINEIKRKAIPELDDEFAKDVDEKYETLAQLKEDIKKDLELEAEEMAKDAVYNSMLDKFMEENPFDIPTVMVREQAMRLVEQQLRQYAMYGIDPAQMGIDKNALAEQNFPVAEKQVKSALIINKIGEIEKINPTEEDTEKSLDEYAERYGKTKDELKKELDQYGGMQSFQNTVFTNMVYGLLLKENKVEDKIITKAERDAKVAEAAKEAGKEA